MNTCVGCGKIHAPRDYEGNQSKWVLHVMLLSLAFSLHLVEHGNNVHGKTPQQTKTYNNNLFGLLLYYQIMFIVYLIVIEIDSLNHF